MINILLCADQIDLISAFYRAVGIALTAEKHGQGPAHFAFKSPISCEIYPPRTPATETFILRIETPDIAGAVARLRQEFSYPDLMISDVTALKTGQKAIVRDPDKRVVELFQPLTLV